MSKRILLVSDNHFNQRILSDLSTKYYDYDYYLHLGDSELPSEEIKPFVGVRGNNDFFRYENEMIIEIGKYRILLTHGHQHIYMGEIDNLAYHAKSKDCNVVFYGHTHRFNDEVIDGVRLINPGSCLRNRDFTPPSYATIEINDDEEMLVKRHNIKY